MASSKLLDSPFMKACRREPVPYTPIWLMRQAGRYMKEYRDVRAKTDFLGLCKHPDLAAEVTVYAAEKLGVDAAIIFSDILLVLEPMGLHLEYAQGEGPLIRNPIRRASDVENLRPVEVEESLGFVMEAIRKTRASLNSALPLIGFSGAPYTVASYAVEGTGSRECQTTKAFMRENPKAWHTLLEKLTKVLADHLTAQIHAGVEAVQIFDSWAGSLSPHEYEQWVWPHSRQLIQRLPQGVPVIHFGTKTAPFLELFAAAGGDVIGVDGGIALDQAWNRIGASAIQGNLDPTVLLKDPDAIRSEAAKILDQASGRPGHIFNLGHGVLQNTPVEHVQLLVEFVHESSRR